MTDTTSWCQEQHPTTESINYLAGPKGQLDNQIHPMESGHLTSVTVITSVVVAGRSGLVVTCLTAVWEDPGSNLTAGICVYHDSHCDIQPLAQAAHLYCSA